MQKVQRVVDHLTKVYGFELVSSAIPRDEFQRLKRNFYIFILNNISQKLFYFLRDKVSSIKYEVERSDDSIWLKTRVNDKVGGLCEIEIRPIPPETAIIAMRNALNQRSWSRLYCDGIFVPQSNDNFVVNLFYPRPATADGAKFFINLLTGEKSLDYHLSYIPELKEECRDYKLNQLLNA